MRIVWSWLRELVEVDADVDEVARRLTLAGLEVESVERHGEQFDGVVVAEVKAKRPHPRADKLTLVTVDAGDGPTEVVCGAPNVPAPGAKVLWARPGARLPDGRVLSPKEIKGVTSPGMLASEVELGLGTAGEGIFVLAHEDAAAAAGALAQDALGLRDVVMEIGLTANRGDCLGHIGVAREVAALCGGRLRPPAAASVAGPAGPEPASAAASVLIEDAQGCARFVARIIEGVRVAPSPRWLRRRLELVGVRPISNLVDVTNYVMFELGHPLHAFDLDKLERGQIIVRRARAGERLTTLDGVDRPLDPDDLVVCDPRGPVGLAGVMGGQATEVSDATQRVLLEAASFEPRAVRRTARRLALHSEASHRFERGVDPNGVERASARAAALMAELAGGHLRAGAVDAYPTPRTPITLALRPERTAALLGMPIGVDEMTRALASLEMQVERGDAGMLRVTVPTVRADIEREVDLIEEVARTVGYDRLPATLPPLRVAPQPSGFALAETARAALQGAGFDEAITYGFTSPARIAALRFPEGHPASRALAITNPMSEDQSVMRTSLVPNLLAAVAHNLAFGEPDLRLFEIGSVFLPALKGKDGLPAEPRFLSGVLAGRRYAWLKQVELLDFSDARGVLETLFQALRLEVDFVPARAEDGFLHPGVGASVVLRVRDGNGGAPARDELPLGVVGEVHPDTRARLAIDRPVYAFELNLERFPALSPTQFTPLPRFPAVQRDVSFFVDDWVPAARVRDLVMAEPPPHLEAVQVLEDYREAGRVPEGKKGMLWSMTYRAQERTLTDAEVDAAHEELVSRLLRALPAQRR